MTDLARIDPNFQVESCLGVSDVQFYNVLQPPFCVHGLLHEGGKFRRMPLSAAAAVGENVRCLHSDTAGGRVRFVTDSPYVALRARMGRIGRMPHFTLIASAGFDMYVREDGREVYSGSFKPPYDMRDGFESLLTFERDNMAPAERRLREITVNFPTFSEVCELYIGLAKGCAPGAPSPYRHEKPIVYYGHSITQGGCASRPGCVYSAILSRRFHCDYINLGFSGSAKGEPAMAEYLAGLDMKLLVYDYDYNAPTVEHLQRTHGPMFQTVRRAHPQLPVIMLTTTPKLRYTGSHEQRVATVYATYRNALDAGDQNVYFLNGSAVCDQSDGHAGATVEGSHINDIGFKCLADALGEIMEPLVL